MSALKQSRKYRRSGVIQDAGSSLWPRSSRSWRDPRKDIEAAGVSGMAVAVPLEDSGVEAGTSGDRGSEEEEGEIETSEVTTKARSGVSVKHLVHE